LHYLGNAYSEFKYILKNYLACNIFKLSYHVECGDIEIKKIIIIIVVVVVVQDQAVVAVVAVVAQFGGRDQAVGVAVDSLQAED
jgi:hypothetical protein